MPSVVNGDLCIKCGTCASVCPVEAFRVADDQYVVDPDTCIDCGVCISECPQSAITSDRRHTAARLLETSARY